MKNHLSSIVLVFICHFNFAQSKSSLSIVLNPIMHRIGNIQNQFISVSHPNIYVNYEQKAMIEFGLQYEHKINETWCWGVGTTWRNISYQVRYELHNSDFSDGLFWLINARQQFIKEHIFGIRFLSQYRINQKHAINFICNVYSPILQESNYDSGFEYQSNIASSTSGFWLYERVRLSFFKTPDIVPELNFQSEILPNFNVVFGAKIKFWSFIPLYYIDVSGYFNHDGVNQVLHHSEISRKDLTYYVGFIYNIPFKKQAKN